MTRIKSILAMPLGQGTGGYELTVKTVKKYTPVKTEHYQEVILTDGSDEILANLKLPRRITIFRNMLIRVIVGRRTETDKSNRMVPSLYVEEWANASPVMSEPDMSTEAEEWYAARQKGIEGKCRYGIVCAMISGQSADLQHMPEATELWKNFVNEWVEYIMTGK